MQELRLSLEQRRNFMQSAHERARSELEALLTKEFEAAEKVCKDPSVIQNAHRWSPAHSRSALHITLFSNQFKDTEMENFSRTRTATLERAESKYKALEEEQEAIIAAEQAKLDVLGPMWASLP